MIKLAMVKVAVAVLALFPAIASAAVDQQAVFGTTVVIPSGLRGQIYHIHRWSTKLPKFEKLKPLGTIYTSSLDVPPQSFKQGFPGVTGRFEWFAIDYTGRFWIENPGSYTFSLLSDDGSKLYIDDRLVVDNDGVHPPAERLCAVDLAGGIHHIHVSYFQGPRYYVALVLRIAPTGQKLRVFSTDDFKPPANPENWRYSRERQ